MWHWNNQVITSLPENCVGFVYLITNLTNNKKYIGKKLAKFAKIRYKMHTQKNGKKVRKKIRSHVDSDWQEYYGSCDALNKDIELLGKHAFKREILHFCTSKSLLSYFEAKEQFYNGVLESNLWYNGQISIRVHGSHILGKC
jgi:hypothetical protein